MFYLLLKKKKIGLISFQSKNKLDTFYFKIKSALHNYTLSQISVAFRHSETTVKLLNKGWFHKEYLGSHWSQTYAVWFPFVLLSAFRCFRLWCLSGGNMILYSSERTYHNIIHIWIEYFSNTAIPQWVRKNLLFKTEPCVGGK